MGEIQLHFLNEFHVSLFKAFDKQYERQVNFEVMGEMREEWPDKKERICRYCQLKGEKTSWNAAHIVSDCLGTHNIYAIDECQNCNTTFNRFETDLCSFLGISRTLNLVEGKNKVPKLKTNILAKADELEGKSGVRITRQKITENDVVVNKELGLVTINYLKDGYIPLNVAKAFVKMAFALLPSYELPFYEYTRKFLLSTDNDPASSGAMNLYGYSIPYNSGVPVPIVWIFKRRSSEANIPSHICIIFWQNFYFQFFIPIHSSDLAMLSGVQYTFPLFPPVFFQKPPEGFPFQPLKYDLSSTIKVREKSAIQFRLSPHADEGTNHHSFEDILKDMDLNNFEVFFEMVERKITN